MLNFGFNPATIFQLDPELVDQRIPPRVFELHIVPQASLVSPFRFDADGGDTRFHLGQGQHPLGLGIQPGGDGRGCTGRHMQRVPKHGLSKPASGRRVFNV